jgi:GT2 family glycosyltransferase
MSESVAVVVPVYNGEEYLAAALSSIAAQSRQPNAVVVVDDGSTDGSLGVARRWQGQLPMEVVTLAVNEGLWSARRHGIAACDTDLVALLDADDFWWPEHLKVMLSVYEHRGGIVSARALRWAPGEALATRDTEHFRPTPSPDRQREALVAENWVFIGTVFSRADYDKAGGYRAFRSAEDWDLWLRMLRMGVRVSVPDAVTMLYRIRPDSLSSADRLLPFERAVLEQFVAEESDPRLRRLAERSLGRRLAKERLLQALELAEHGHGGRARMVAVRSLRGSRAIRMQGLAAVAAPRATAAARRRRLADVGWLSGR